MNKSPILLSFRVASIVMMASLVLGAETADGSRSDHVIVASHETASFGLVLAMRITVKYENNSMEDWSLYQPDECTCVLIRAVAENRYHGAVGFNLGKSGFVRSRLPDGSEVVARTVEIPPKVSIEAGESYLFEVDLNSPFRDSFHAGHWTYSVTDRMENLVSESVSFTIVVTQDSVDQCLEVAGDESIYDYTRRWHGDYLAKVRPDLPFDFRGRNRTPDEEAEMWAKNKQALEDFNTWWPEHRDTEEVEEALERINEEAGVLEEYRALRDEQAAAAEEEAAAGDD